MSSIFCIIPARKNSKSIKLKNFVRVKKKKLIEYSIEFAKKLQKKYDMDICVSSDYKNINSIIRKHNLNFLGLRPNKLSKDNSLTKDVVLYELNKFQKKLQKKYTYILLLQPTTPIRSLKDIENALKLIKNKNKKYDSIVSIKNVDGNHPLRMKTIKSGYLKNYINQNIENMIPRQKLPKVYIRSGSFYLIKKNKFLKYKSLVGKKTGYIILKNIYSLNIDGIEDLIIFRNFYK
tara:strand:- start:1434 stop:2135 length:702 start_codon:yes stop_codon:yes gene_type:complete